MRKKKAAYIEPEDKVKMLTEHFDKFNCDYLGLPKFDRKGNMVFRAVRFRGCGHEQDVCYTNSTRKDAIGGPICKQCQKEAKDVLFTKHNYEVLDQITKDKFLVKKPCGHITHAYIDHMKHYDVIECRECIFERHLRFCENMGLEYIEPRSPTKALYKFKCCGAEKELFKIAVERGNCLCPSCGNGWMTKPSKLYLFEMETTSGFVFLKFGYGKDLNNRLREYRLKDCTLKNIIYTIDLPSGFVAMKEELRIHGELGERLDKVEMRKYLTRGGFSECYDHSKLDSILTKMKALKGE